MIIKFLGTGTSQGIPVIGCNCECCSSKNSRDKRLRSSVFIEVDNTKILIDTGPDLRQQLLENEISNVDLILLTHEHNDHIGGLDDIRPINFKHNKTIPVYALERVLESVKLRYGYIFNKIPYPGAPKIELNTITSSSVLTFGSAVVQAIEVIHGDLTILGFRIGNFAYLTDISSLPPASLTKLEGLDVIVISALQMVSHHSHISLPQAISLAHQIGAKQTYFIHMSHTLGPMENWIDELGEGIDAAYDGLKVEC